MSAPEGIPTPRVAYRYIASEAGSFTVFSLFIFMVMIMVGGLAVDMMRFEAERKRLQNTIDGAVLAASDLKQELDSEAVVRSHFAKQGYDPASVNVQVTADYFDNNGTQDLVARTVTATSELRLNTILMPTVGIDELRTVAAGQANESRQNVEISLIVDISGTMRYGAGNSTNDVDNRILALREAVTEFVDIVLQVNCDSFGANCVQSPNTSGTTINIIPYAGNVNVGPEMFDYLGGERWHDWSSCMEVTDADFDHMNLPSGSSEQLPHFMKWSVNWTWMDWGWCPQDSARVLYAENDAQTIKDYINTIRLHDGTATHVGMKFGTALLNPTSRPAFEWLAAQNAIEDEYKDRPLDFDENVVKYVILMTDGQTTDQFRPSNVDYQVLYKPEGARTSEENALYDAMMDRYGSVDAAGNPQDPGDVEKGYPSTNKYNDGTKTHSKSENNKHLLEMCKDAKDPIMATGADGNEYVLRNDRITVFTIAFLAPSGAIQNMKDCASTETHFYNVRTLKVGDAFASIARTINQLRLTQ